MEYRIVILPDATIDFEKSIEWYDNINPSLAKQFIVEIETTISFISKNPLLFQYDYGTFKSVNTSKFLFKIVYRINGDEIVIVAIFHHKRNPKILYSRIK